MKVKSDSLRELKKDSLKAMGLTFKESKPEITYLE
jgi:hypothetical protein